MKHGKEFARIVVFSVYDGQQRLGHAIESTSAKHGFDVFIGDQFVNTVSTQDEARDAIFAAFDGPGSAK
jgi:hypothetical protein